MIEKIHHVGVAVVDTLRRRSLATRHPLERAGHLGLPAGDMRQDVFRAPGPVEHAAHRALVQRLDRREQLLERRFDLADGAALVHVSALRLAEW